MQRSAPHQSPHRAFPLMSVHLFSRLLAQGLYCLLGLSLMSPALQAAEEYQAKTASYEVSPTASSSPAWLAGKRLIGPVAEIQEATSGVSFLARVDTGAKSCSLHVEETLIDNPAEDMRENIGKMMRFRVIDPETEKNHWIEAKITGTVIIKNAEEKERRYKVWLSLLHGDLEKRVCVTLNDRSKMDYPMLLGRNFLKGDYLVDVSAELAQ